MSASDRPLLKADEIEITPEMIEAGYLVLRNSCLTDDLLEADRLTVVEIFQAMRSPPAQEPPRRADLGFAPKWRE